MRTANAASLGQGAARLHVERAGFAGAEMRSAREFGVGDFAARLRPALPAGTIAGFFLYQHGVGDGADEIDIELIGGTRRILFTSWLRGRRIRHRADELPFDPAADFHEYRIVRTGRRLRFLVDGAEAACFDGDDLPRARMPLHVNAWWPAWLDAGAEAAHAGMVGAAGTAGAAGAAGAADGVLEVRDVRAG